MHDSATAQWSHAPRHAEAHLTPDFTCPEHEPEHLSRRVADLRFFIPHRSVLHCPGTSQQKARRTRRSGQPVSRTRRQRPRTQYSNRTFDGQGALRVCGSRGMSRIRCLRLTSSARSARDVAHSATKAHVKCVVHADVAHSMATTHLECAVRADKNCRLGVASRCRVDGLGHRPRRRTNSGRFQKARPCPKAPRPGRHARYPRPVARPPPDK